MEALAYAEIVQRSPMLNHDNRQVALIKSLATNNRFYALVTEDSGIRNADTVESIPQTILLGIAYPCLEDGLNDFAVIRTTYDTLEYFPDDPEMRSELMEIVHEARVKLERRLTELRDCVAAKQAHFLGTDLEEFKSYALDIVQRGYPRRNLDSMMKLNVFSSVAEHEGKSTLDDPLYNYEFRDKQNARDLLEAPPRDFVAALFADVLDSVLDEGNYQSRYTFDRNVFQKFIALMFVNYATTDPIFYGTNKADYGVSGDKDMQETPLYRAVKSELVQIELRLMEEAGIVAPAPAAPYVAASHLDDSTVVQLPGTLINEDVLMGPIASLCAAAHQLQKSADGQTMEFAGIILGSASNLVQELKRLGLLSPFAYDPGDSQPSV